MPLGNLKKGAIHMKKMFEGTLTRRLLSLALSIAMVLSVLPAGALAEEVESTPPTCTCEVLCAETVNESCPVCGTEGGQCAAVQQQEPQQQEPQQQEPQQQEPQQQESEQKQEPVQEPKTEACAHGNDPETCEDCASEARVASVQALIVALPEDVTAETKEAAQSALSAVDEAKSALTESEQAKLDMTRYTALTQKLAALEAQMNNCAHGNDPESCPLCAVQALIDALPDGDSITADNAEEVIEQMGQIDAAAMLMTDDELTKLDFTKFDAAEARLSELAEEQNPEQTATYADNIPYLVCDSNGQNWKTETCESANVVTESNTEWSNGWYVVQEDVTIVSRITVNGDVHLILADNSSLTASYGIVVNEGNSLTIYAQSDDTNMGRLTATGNSGYSAGIGGYTSSSTGSNPVNAGSITINGGYITAKGGTYSAGIGGTYCGNGGNITINGGTVEATGGYYGAGIGGGQYGSGGSIEITNSNVTATGGVEGAGIGGGRKGAGGNITINDGTIIATGKEGGAGIGGGNGGSAETIEITGGTFTATGAGGGAGIGGGNGGSAGTIEITGGSITAKTTGSYAAGIGGGSGGAGGRITIRNAEVTATGGSNAAGIGGGSFHSADTATVSSGTIEITNSTVTATGGSYGAGIGGGMYGSCATVTISGGTVIAEGGEKAAGIGGGQRGSGGSIEITNSNVTATGGNEGAGIGGGQYGSGGSITISSGTVTANGGTKAAGIGNGRYGNSGTNTFSTGGNGNAVIIASSISDTSGKDNNSWSGVIIEGSEGQVYGTTVTPTADFVIPEGKTLTVPVGSTLDLQNVTANNNGTLYNYGTINGTVIGNQPVKIKEEYLDDKGVKQTANCNAEITAEYLESNINTLSGGWYVVKDTVTIGEEVGNNRQRVTVNGNVNLILADGCDFTVNGGIEVGSGSSLTIWGQEGGTGKLTARNAPAGKAGIGGYAFNDGGTITINGGIISAKGGGSGGGGAGIGGKCTVEINGGNVSAYGGGEHAAGIGGSSSTVIRITGGTVYAQASIRGAAIGGNASQDGGTITITGGHITTVPQYGGACIGGGHYQDGSNKNHLGNGGTISISNAIIIANNNGDTSGIGGPGNTGDITIKDSVVFIADNSRQDQSALVNTNSIIFKGNEGTVYGRPTLRTDLTIAEGQTLAIPEGTSLTIPAGVTLTNNGKVYLAGTLEGTIPGDVYYPLNLTDCTAEGDVVTYPDENGTPYAKAGSLITLTPDIPTNMAFTSWFTEEDIWDNRFNMPKNAVTITAKYEVPVASVTVDGIATNYAYFNEAYFAANNAKGTDITLKLLETLEKVPAVTVTGSFTLDLNGKKLTYTSMNSEAISVNGSLTITDSSDSKDGVIQNNTTSYVICNYGRLTIEGGAILAQNCICNSNNGTLVMNDGTLGAIGTDPGYRIFNEAGGTVTINGGTLKNGADRIFNTAEGITLQGGSFPNGIRFTDDFLAPHVRSLLADGYAYYDSETNDLVSVDNERTYIDRGVVVLEHPEHDLSYEKKDDQHTATCKCGYSETEPHDFLKGDGFCTVCDAYQPADYEAGIYGIKNAGQLFWFADYVNKSAEPEARFARGQLQNDITIQTKADGTNRAWTPIGTEGNSYLGVFNGNGHSISGLYFEGEMPHASLFGAVEGRESRIENLTIQSVEYDVSVSTDKIAGICGFLDGGQIINCTNAAHISSPRPDVYAAGICYENNGTISGCTNAGRILTGDSATAGGICVINNRSISKCTNEGEIHGSDAGGICAENGSHDNRSSSIENCANRGQINGSYIAGGICARNFGTVSYCYHYGSLNGGTNGGPIVGELLDGGSCSNCYYLAYWEADEIDGTTFKTQEQFASGEVAYLLCDNPSSNADSWGQTLAGKNKQDYPVLDGDPVYRHNSSCPVYSNKSEESGNQHSLGENGICERCGAALEARVTVGGTDTYYTSLKDAFKAANKHTATITLLRDANIDETLEISGGEVTFQSAEYHGPAAEEGPTFYTITFERNDAAIRVADDGIFNFESGILKVSPGRQQLGIVVDSGGTLNFRGGAITGPTEDDSTEDDSIKMVGGEVNISGGTVGLVEASRGTLNISGGTVHTLRVYDATTNLRGGSFQKIHMMFGGDVVFTLLADGYAYYCDGSWVDATNGEDAMTLEGDIRVRSIPVKINTQPKDITLTYGEDKSLFVEAKGDRISYLWFDGEDPIPEADGSTLSLSTLNAVTHNIYCRLICDDYVLDSDTVTVTVNKAIVETPTVDSKEYTGENQKADISDTDLYTVTKNDGGTDVGTYSVTLKLKNTTNYKWSDSEVAEKTISFQITKADNGWTQKPAISDWTYGENASNPTMGSAKFGTAQVTYLKDETVLDTVPTNAGSYTARFTVDNTTNYAVLTMDVPFTINPKGITVTITPNGGTYGGTITPATAVANDLVPGDTVDVTLTYTGTANDGTDYNSTTVPTQAGTYTVTASISDPNYKLTGAVTADFTIARAQAVITVDESYKGYMKTYGDADFQLEGITENSDDVDGVQYIASSISNVVSVSDRGMVTIKEAGTATITLSLPESDNYLEAEDVDIKIQVNKATGSVAITVDPGKTYDGQPAVLTDTMYTTIGDGDVTVEYAKKDDTTYSTTAPKDAGNYTVRVTQAAGTNYLKAETSQDFTITKKEVTITGTTVAESKVYDGTTTAEITSNGTLSANYDGNNLTIVPGSAAYDTEKVSENKDVTFSDFALGGSAKDNYTLTAQPATVKASITAKSLSDSDITVTVSDLTYTGNQQSPTVTVKYGTITLVKDTDYTLSGNTATAAGTYTLTVTGTGNYTDFTTKDWKIDKASITPVVTIENTVYGNTPNPTVSGNPGNGVVTYTYYSDEACTTEVTPKNVGTYYVKATVAATDNYQSGTSNAVSFQITKKALTVKAKDHTITYGEASANSGVEYSGFVNGETEAVLGGTLAYTYSYIPYSDVGSYTITPGGLTSDNYDITFVAGDLIVQQKEIGIAWGNTAFTYSGLAQKPVAYPRGLVNGDSITLTVIGEQTNAGSGYTATVTAIVGYMDAGNYKLPSSDLTTTFSIAKKEVTITGTAVEATKVYDGTTTARISNYGSLSDNYDGEGLTIVPGTAAYDNKNVGESKITFSGFSLGGSAAGNYTLTAQPASVTASITKKPVTLAIAVGENLFDGTNGVNYSTSLEEGQSFVENDDVAIESGNATFAYCYPAENIPVTFTAFSLTGADAGNYSITNPTPENVTGSIKVSNRYLNLENNDDFAGQTEVWVDGVACPVQTDAGTYAALPESGDLLTTYTYKQGTSTAAHENYPTGMAVYSIVRDDGGAKLQKITELGNLLQYSGCSIRINGKPGIRMITSLTKEAKEALKKGELAGYTLEEYGTVVAWDVGADMQLPLTLGNGNKHNYAYKKGVSDPVFANVGALTQYTNVLVWDSLTDAQLAQDILMRPYIILSKDDGKTVTLYGGTVSRSIGYVAQQNADTFPKGSAGYKYVHDIIDRVANLNPSNESTTTAGGNGE